MCYLTKMVGIKLEMYAQISLKIIFRQISKCRYVHVGTTHFSSKRV